MEAVWSEMFGYRRCDFEVAGPDRMGFVTFPAEGLSRADSAWLWYAPTFITTSDYKLPKSLHEYYLSAALAAGVAVAGVDVGESWGAPYGREIFTKFYELVTREFALSAKPCLMPQSRGGLMHYNWAAEHPDCVGAIGAIYPVCDSTRPERVEALSTAYGISIELLLDQHAQHNPVERIGELARRGVPILHIHGLQDDVVPFATNSKALVDNYRAHGGEAELIEVPDKGHEEVPEFFRNQRMLEFYKTAGDCMKQ